MMTRICRLLRVSIALCVCFAVLGGLEGCASDAREVLGENVAETPVVSRQPLHLHVLRHGSNNSVNTDNNDNNDHDDRLVSILLVGAGKATDLRQVGEYMSFSFNDAVPVTPQTLTSTDKFYFVGNLQQDTLKSLTNALPTAKYIRSTQDDLINGTPFLTVGSLMRNQFEFRNGKYVTKNNVELQLERVVAIFDLKTLPIPSNCKIKKVTVERIPAKFCAVGDLGGKSYEELNASNSKDFPYMSMNLWGSSDNSPSVWLGFASKDPKADRVVQGTFFMPPVKAKLTKVNNQVVDPFGKSTNAGMPFLRFVFTDPRGNTLVRLFRLGNSDTTGDNRGDIDRNGTYKIRVHLLGRSVLRDESLKDYDEGTIKAEFLN